MGLKRSHTKEAERVHGRVTIFRRNIIELFWKQVGYPSMQDGVMYRPDAEVKEVPSKNHVMNGAFFKRAV